MWTVAEAVSARNEYMILSSEVRQGGWAGDIPADGYGSLESSVTNMQVDYVRVYQSVPEPTTVATFSGTLSLLLWRRRKR